MTNLSIQQALNVYTHLVRAYYKDHYFGTDTAEIYAYLLKQNNPSAEAKIPGATKADNLQAAENLYNIILLFKEQFNCKVYVENKLFGKWVKKIDYDHRLHIKIIRRDL